MLGQVVTDDRIFESSGEELSMMQRVWKWYVVVRGNVIRILSSVESLKAVSSACRLGVSLTSLCGGGK